MSHFSMDSENHMNTIEEYLNVKIIYRGFLSQVMVYHFRKLEKKKNVF